MKGQGLMVTVETPACVVCNQSTFLVISREQYSKLIHPHGPHIQDVFPDWTPAERELLLTGTHDKCWNKIFSEADEDDEVIA